MLANCFAGYYGPKTHTKPVEVNGKPYMNITTHPAEDVWRPMVHSGKPVSDIDTNGPCPCGSGKKYGHCHLGATSPSVLKRAQAYHVLDRQLIRKMTEFLKALFGLEWSLLVNSLYPPGSMADGLTVNPFAPWSVYHLYMQGRPLVDWFITERGPSLSATELEWLAAQRLAWTSIWEIVAIRREVGVFVHDLFTGKRCFVHERQGSRGLSVKQCVLARVVDYKNIALFCGIHNVPLPKERAIQVVDSALHRIAGPPGTAPAETLRGEGLDRGLINLWKAEVASGRF